MDNIKNIFKNHFVEVVGFIAIFILITFILFLKYYKKTYVCESNKEVDGAKIYEKYTIHQKNNNIKSIDYLYEAKLPSSRNKKAITTFYNEMIQEVNNNVFEGEINLKYKKNKIVLEYTLTKEDIKDNKAYKSARVFMRNIKSNDFKCK